jgi:hypothetical protein
MGGRFRVPAEPSTLRLCLSPAACASSVSRLVHATLHKLRWRREAPGGGGAAHLKRQLRARLCLLGPDV